MEEDKTTMKEARVPLTKNVELTSKEQTIISNKKTYEKKIQQVQQFSEAKQNKKRKPIGHWFSNKKLTRSQIREKLDNWPLEKLQNIMHQVIQKDTNLVQKAINFIVQPQPEDIKKYLDYDVMSIAWINKNRQPKYWKLGVKPTEQQLKWWREVRIPTLLENGYIEEVKEEDAKHIIPTFILTTIKLTGKLKNREIMDFKVANAYIKNISAILPGYKELHDWAKEYTVFATIDFSNAYQRIIIKPEDRPYCCFQMDGKTYQWKRMPFGLNMAPAIYQRFVQQVLRKIPGTTNYLDDVLIAGKDKAQCRQRVKMVIEAIEKAKIEWNEAKSSLEPKEVQEFLGYYISRHGFTNNEARKSKITSILTKDKGRMTVKQLARLLGQLNFIIKQQGDKSVMQTFYDKISQKIKVFGNDWKKFEDKMIKLSKQEISKIMTLVNLSFSRGKGVAENKDEINRYRQYNYANAKKFYKEQEANHNVIYVDSSPYAVGIFRPKDPTNAKSTDRLIKMTFPKELQRYATKAGLKELIGYYFAYKYFGKNVVIKGDNEGMTWNIKSNKWSPYAHIIKPMQKNIQWISGQHPMLDVADAVSRESDTFKERGKAANRFFVLDKHLQTKLTHDSVQRFQLQLEDRTLVLNLGKKIGDDGKGQIRFDLDFLFNDLPPKIEKNLSRYKGASKIINIKEKIKQAKKQVHARLIYAH